MDDVPARWIEIVRRHPWRAMAGVAVVAAGFAGSAFWKAARTLSETRARVAAEGEVPFRSARLDRLPPPGVETIDAPAVFRDAVQFHGRLFLCGPGGLFEYSADGAVAARYRTGFELPPAPAVAMAVGVPADSGEQELLIATAGEGLLAYNGRVFRQVRAESAADRTLAALLPLDSGRVLLGTEKHGLLVYDGKRIAQFHPSFSGFHVTALAGNESDLWVGTLDRGVLHWRGGQLDRFSEREGLPDVQVLSLAVASDAAYVGTAMGVAEFRDGRFTRMLASGFIAHALLARSGTLAVGTLDEGVIEIPTGAERPRPQRSSREVAARIERLMELDGKLYALAEDGLYSAQSGDWRPVLRREGATLADRNISALAVDSSGRLWVGYFDRGLEIVEPGGGRSTHVEDEHVFCVNRIVHSPNRGVSAVATANGLVLFDVAGVKRRVLGRQEGLIANHVTDVVFTASGMAVATPAGITFIDAAGTRSLYAFHGLVNNHVYALASTGDRLLAGTLGGLSILDGSVISTSFTTANSGLKHNWVSAIVPVGDDWFVGTYGAGVLKLDSSGHWHAQPGASGAFEVNPNAMLATAESVYAGTLGHGLLVYSRASGRWTTRISGLPSLNVTALAAQGGYLYIGTDNGLIRVEER